MEPTGAYFTLIHFKASLCPLTFYLFLLRVKNLLCKFLAGWKGFSRSKGSNGKRKFVAG